VCLGTTDESATLEGYTRCTACSGTGRTPGAHESLYWHKDQTVTCPGCDGSKAVTYYQGPGATNLAFRDCPDCSGKGTIPRPCPKTAQPITEVHFTDWPTPSLHKWYWDREDRKAIRCDDWKGIKFYPPVPAGTVMVRALLNRAWAGATSGEEVTMPVYNTQTRIEAGTRLAFTANGFLRVASDNEPAVAVAMAPPENEEVI
jgi:hypothetical protein